MPGGFDEGLEGEVMDSELSLVVLRDKRVVEFVKLGFDLDHINPIAPKRKPQHETDSSKFWVVDSRKRQALVGYVDGVYDKVEDSHKERESLFCWFGLMGIASRWLRDTRVVWGLYLSPNEIVLGEGLRA